MVWELCPRGRPHAAPDAPARPHLAAGSSSLGDSATFSASRGGHRCLAAASSCVSQAPGPGGGLESPCALFLAPLCPPPTGTQGLWLLQLQSLALLLHQPGQRCPLFLEKAHRPGSLPPGHITKGDRHCMLVPAPSGTGYSTSSPRALTFTPS